MVPPGRGGGGMLADARALKHRLAELSEQRSQVVGVPQPAGRLIPVHVNPKKKQPIRRHKGGAWTDAMCDEFFTEEHFTECRIGIILEYLMVLDFDAMCKYTEAAARFHELRRAPSEQTSKGMHVYLWRTPAVEAAGITDSPLRDPSIADAKEARKRMSTDCKTRTANKTNGYYTGGLVVCAPTAGYTWVKGCSIFEVEPAEPSPSLIAWLVKYTKRKASFTGKSTTPRVAPRATAAPIQPSLPPIIR